MSPKTTLLFTHSLLDEDLDEVDGLEEEKDEDEDLDEVDGVVEQTYRGDTPPRANITDGSVVITLLGGFDL